MNKAIGDLASRMEASFGELKVEMAKNHGDLKTKIKPIVWQVRILLGGGITGIYNIFVAIDSMLISIRLWCFSLKLTSMSITSLTKSRSHSLEPTQVVSRPADARKVEPKK